MFHQFSQIKHFFWDIINFVIVFGIIISLTSFGFVYFAQNNPNSNIVKKINYLLDNSTAPQNSSTSQSSTQTIAQKPKNFDGKSAIDIVKETLPSVISINTINRVENKVNAGTGYVVSDDGLVVTNKHVISIACKYGAENLQITAIDKDGLGYNLLLKSIDPVDDVAILKFEKMPPNLQKVNFGKSADIQLGEDVVAIGNALGTLQNTVTKGIISGLGRSFESNDLKDECTNNESQIDDLIQTDAAINKGNSGGPLFNSNAQVIGMNTLGTSDAQSVGLAIPSDTIVKVLNGYLKNNQISRPRLGVISQPINPATKLQNTWLPVDYGEFIGSFDVSVPENKAVSTGSTANNSGLNYGDIIIEINGNKLIQKQNNPSPLRRSILEKQVGETIEITYLKANKTPTSNIFVYETSPKKTKARLSGINYNLQTNKIETTKS